MAIYELYYDINEDTNIPVMDAYIKTVITALNGTHQEREWQTDMSKFSKRFFPRIAAWPWTKTRICHRFAVPNIEVNQNLFDADHATKKQEYAFKLKLVDIYTENI
jgi:hypothetical protein